MGRSSSAPSEAGSFPRITAVPRPHPPRQFSLPATIDALFGREREIAEVAGSLRSSRLLVLTGPGGVGKTRLAIASATTAADSFRDGARFVALAPIRDPALVATTIARAVGMRESGAQPTSIWLAETLADRDLLLVLDNFEHLLPARNLIGELLAACLTLTFLVTSRARLHLTGERDIPVLPLTVPPQPRPPPQRPPSSAIVAPGPTEAAPREGNLGAIRNAPAVQLFVNRAVAVNPSFRFTERNAPHVAEICRRVDGLPLAIELAAARTSLLPPSALLARLEQRLPLLEGGPRDQPERLQTMRQAIAWSYDLLPPDARAAFQCLAVFVGSFGLDAAEEVCGASLRVMTELIDQSLLQSIPSDDDEPRCTMLETIREFGFDELAVADRQTSVRDRHAVWCVELVTRLEPDLFGGRGQVPSLRRLEQELPNLRAAYQWLSETGCHESALRLPAALFRFFFIRGRNSEGREWLEEALGRATSVGAPLRAWGLLGLAMVAMTLQDHDRSSEAIGEALTLINPEQNPKGHCFACIAQALLAYMQGQFTTAATFAAAGEAAAEGIGSRWDAHVARFLRAKAQLYAGDLEDASDNIRDLIASAQGEEVYIVAAALHDGGILSTLRDDHQGALAYFSRALAAFQELGEIWNAAASLEGAAVAALGLVQAERAVYLFGAAAALRAWLRTPVLIPDRPAYDQAIAAAREALSEPAFAAAWAAGEAATLDEAVACVSHLAAKAAATIAPPISTPISGARLTPREREVLALLAAAKSDKQIGSALFISHRTAMWHVGNVLDKLGVATRGEAAEYAIRHGLA